MEMREGVVNQVKVSIDGGRSRLGSDRPYSLRASISRWRNVVRFKVKMERDWIIGNWFVCFVRYGQIK